jgi:hypothetical protein
MLLIADEQFFEHPLQLAIISGLQMKSWTGKALETVNCFAFLKCKLIVVLTANLKSFCFFFLCNVLQKRE